MNMANDRMEFHGNVGDPDGSLKKTRPPSESAGGRDRQFPAQALPLGSTFRSTIPGDAGAAVSGPNLAVPLSAPSGKRASTDQLHSTW